jgi:hypothetical protein
MTIDPRGERDARLRHKPQANEGQLPVMTYDWKDMPLTSENIWHAQMAGWPRILTYDYVADSALKKRLMSHKRYHSLTAAGVVNLRGQWRDEYPFASTVENGGSVFVGHAPVDEQIRQGILIRQFYADHEALLHSVRAATPFFFEVKVINYPGANAFAASRPDRPKPVRSTPASQR